jgi:hypothetical protein
MAERRLATSDRDVSLAVLIDFLKIGRDTTPT